MSDDIKCSRVNPTMLYTTNQEYNLLIGSFYPRGEFTDLLQHLFSLLRTK